MTAVMLQRLIEWKCFLFIQQHLFAVWNVHNCMLLYMELYGSIYESILLYNFFIIYIILFFLLLLSRYRLSVSITLVQTTKRSIADATRKIFSMIKESTVYISIRAKVRSQDVKPLAVRSKYSRESTILIDDILIIRAEGWLHSKCNDSLL